MIIQLISVGKLSNSYALIAQDFEKMIRWKLKNMEVLYNQKLPLLQIKQFEAKLINKYIAPSDFNVCLDVLGEKISSHEFARFLQHSNSGKINFIIGGAFGLDQSIIDKAHKVISLSDMTLPHKLAKIILLEQIYRAQSIIDNHPYHK